MVHIACCSILELLVALLIIQQSKSIVLHNEPGLVRQLYVVPFSSILGNDGDGSLIHPYSSLQQALDHIERDYHQDTSTTINLYPTHHFVDHIRLEQVHSQTTITTMNIHDTLLYESMLAHQDIHRREPQAIISGGIPITHWKKVNSTTYSAIVPSAVYVNQLFVDNRRVARTRVPTNYSEYLRYEAPLNDSKLARYGFQYQSGDFNYTSLADAMVIVYHSWTESHHYIDRLIRSNNTVLFSNPAAVPIGTFVAQGRRRYHIENLCEALIPNSFCFVNATQTVYLMTDGSYDPNRSQIITSVNETIVSVKSDDMHKPVHHINIDNVAIQHGAWHIDRTQVADAASADFLKSVALFIANATFITVSNVDISHTGSYGIRVKEGTSNISIKNSRITDMGAGGIWIGDRSSNMSISPTLCKILSTEIGYGGNVFFSAVGVLIQQATDIVVSDNTIHHLRYNGISVGQGGYQLSTRDVLIQRNYVYNTGQHILSDQGGIYTLGIQPGTVITNNVVKNVFSYSVFMWGIYLDDGSSEIVVSNNIVYNTGWACLFQHYGANNTIVNNVFARSSLSRANGSNSDGEVRIQEAENHRSWTYTRNIVYDTYQGINAIAYKADPGVNASFSDNVYFSAYGAPLLFASELLSFADWQKTGQDNSSVVANPLFTGDVHQCDFFTIQANSPAAKLGFVNITKLPHWTPGCETSDDTDYIQFYHW